MTEKEYCYVLSKYAFYDTEWIIMVSTSMDEIITYFMRKCIQLENDYGLVVRKYEFGVKYSLGNGETIRWIEKENGKIKDLKRK